MDGHEQSFIIDCAQHALDALDHQIVGLEEQERQIEQLITEFQSSQQGQCCLLEGEPNCGRESVLMKVLEKFDLPLRVVNVGYISADPLIQETLAREKNEGFSVFLIRDADELLTPHQQEFLYTMADKATRFSWFVFFSITRHSFAAKLEKRGTSRMPRIRVTFDQAPNFEEFCGAFRKFLIPANNKNVLSPYYIEFVDKLNYQKWLKPVYERYNYDVLKQIAAQILMRIAFIDEKENFETFSAKDVTTIIEETIGFCIPGNNRRLQLLHDQTLRTQCVFLCIHRLVKNRPADNALLTPKTTYRTVFLEYKKLANKNYTILDVHSDIFIFREIDHLVELGLVKADKGANVTNTSFRKVWLDVDPLTVEKSIPSFQLPTKMTEEYDVVAPPNAKKMKTDMTKEEKKILYVVLEGCSLETAKIGGEYVILASDKHANFLRKQKKDPADYRPDILHQCLLNLLDSPLNRAGKLRVFFRTTKNVLVDVSPQCRIPRTFDRFCGLMVQLLHKLSIRAAETSQKLMSVIKNPVTNYLPVGSKKILMSFNTQEICLANKLVSPESDEPLVVIIGGIARGKISIDYNDSEMKISNYPLSAALACAKVTSGLEEIWGII
ncbi:unnamed protein product [Caenorhabditis bovis]|uniref:18S rRNA (pseudouridine-N1)-methyltransferase n=1 Tax=Caenorhabditis bovis TaxID=2654633 RepID=A0A8S1EMQ0_9PELO|nr:unnamed protein product [Caenorhabditis bovis]